MSVAGVEHAATRSASSAAGRGATTGRGDVHALARKLAAKSTGPEQTAQALRGLGFTKSQAREAADKAHGTPAAKPAAKPKSRPTSSTSTPAASTSSTSSTSAPAPVEQPGPRLPELPTVSAPAMDGNASGFALGIVAMAVLINFMHGGSAGVKAWAAAKFLNRARSTSTPAAPATPGGSGRSGLPGAGAKRPPAGAGSGASGGGSGSW